MKKGISQIELLKSQLARALSDYDNFRKRTEREREGLEFIVTARLVSRFLPVLDQLYEAQRHLNDGGISLTIKEFEDTLRAEGIEQIYPREGEEFSEELHEAIDTVSVEGLKNNQIAEVAMRGWKFSEGLVVRHAKVKVNKLEGENKR